jgi:chromosome segregation ATPase
VENDPANINNFMGMWQASNEELREEIADIPVGQLEEGLAELLVHYGIEKRLQLLWALRFDERDGVREALEAGLADEITSETSRLLSQAQQQVLALSLESAQEQVTDLQSRLAKAQSDLEDSQRLLQRKKEQLGTEQARVENLQEENSHLRAQIHKYVHDLESLSVRWEQTQEQLTEEQAQTEELRHSLRHLKETLRAQIEGSRQEEVQERLNEALLKLEEERKETASLRLGLRKLEQQVKEAYAKRDIEQERSSKLEQKVERLEHDKGVIIEEKRRLTERIHHLDEELRGTHDQVKERAVSEILRELPLNELNDRWTEDREAIRDHLHALVAEGERKGDITASPIDRWVTWEQWLEDERALLQDALTPTRSDDEDNLGALRRAQELLALRWYLLECTRQVILTKMQDTLFL